jgi:Peptidase A4 family
MKRCRYLAAATTIVGALVLAAGASAASAPNQPSAAGPLSLANPLSLAPMVPAGPTGSGSVSSTNWSGYAATGSAFSDVKGSWVAPTATCPSASASYSSFWVGIDGYTSSTVEQLGTSADCRGKNNPHYYAWYEMYPANPVNLSLSIEPGDTISAQVLRSGTSYTLSLTDSRSGSFSIKKTLAGAADSSAEWIAEAPEICSITCSIAPLADFGIGHFSKASATDSTATGSISAFPHAEIVMKSGSVVKAQPSALSATGAAFSDTWKHS